MDLEPAQIKVKKGGGNAGHNGLKSIQAHVGTADFWRVRLGIGHPGAKNLVSNYVLSNFYKAEEDWVAQLLGGLSRHADLLVKNDMNGYTSKVQNEITAPVPTELEKKD